MGALDSQPQVIKFTSWLPMVGGSLRVRRLPQPLKLVAMIVQDRIICNTREYDLNRIGWCLRFNDLAPFTVFDYFSHPFYRETPRCN
jgi:hypothetical protein